MKTLLAMRKWYLLVLMLGLWLPSQAWAQTGETIYLSTLGGNQILKVVDSATPVATVFHTGGTGDTTFVEGIVVGPDNKIYIADTDASRIWRLSQDGMAIEKVYDFAQCTGACPKGGEGPSFSTTGDLYFNTRDIAHTGIWKITSSQLSGSLPVTTATNVVTAAQDGSTFGEDTRFDATDKLLFVDRSGGKVWRFDSLTNIISGLSTPIGIAVNSTGDIFVANTGTNSVKHYDANGNPASVPDFVTFTPPDMPVFLKFDASGNLFVVTAQDFFADSGKVWRVNPSGNKTLVVDLTMTTGVGTKAWGLALPATSFTTAQQAVSPGTLTTYTNGSIMSEGVLLPPNVVMNGTAFMAENFIQRACTELNSTIPAGGSIPNTWSGGFSVPGGSKFTPIAGTGGFCMILEKLCYDMNHALITPCNIATPAPPTPLIELTIHYQTQASQSNPAVVIFSDGGIDYANITNFFNPDNTGGGGTKVLNTSTSVLNQPTALPADTTPPTVTASTSPLPNGAGWNNTSPVNVLISASDDQTINHITYSTAGAQTIGSTTVIAASTLFPIANQGSTTVSFSATDNATPTPFTTNGTPLVVNIDTTPPTITITTPPSGATYTITQAVASSYACADAGSGVATCAGPVASGANIDTASVGSKTFTVNSTDVAGNSATSSVAYTVAGYSLCLLYDPTHAVKSGAAIPLKLYLCDANGNDLSNSGTVVNATSLVQVSSGTTDTIVDAGSSNVDNNFRFDSTLGPSGGYIFNLKTTGLATGTYNLHFTAGADTTDHFLVFQVK